jgi:hypothetical protein
MSSELVIEFVHGLVSRSRIMLKKWSILTLVVLVLPAFAADDPPPLDQPEFVFARLVYPGGRGGFGFRGRSRWATDFPEADYKFMYGIKRLSGVRVQEEENPVAIMDDKLFQYPYVYAVEVGSMNLGTAEAGRLREYFLRGGFLHADDFWGVYEFQNFQREMLKVFPERQMVELPLNHEIFHTFFDINSVMQIPNVRNACSGGRTWENPTDTRPRILGISDDNGRVMVVVTYNSDLGDAWEWMDEPCYPELYSGQAYRMGLNFIVYALSH